MNYKTIMRDFDGANRRPHRFLYCLLLACFTYRPAPVDAADTAAASDAWKPTEKAASDAHLFTMSEKIRVIGPTHFPAPTHRLALPPGRNASILVAPSYGSHRSDADAIFAYAEGYQIPYYMMFMETLTDTGFRGDIVLAIADDWYIHSGVKEYLLPYTTGDASMPNLVIYQLKLDCDGSPDRRRAVLGRTKDTDAFQMCRLDHVYGYFEPTTNAYVPVQDPREGRVVATLRYEWYWIWCQQYRPHSWLMLVDARDTFFQSDPFQNLPRAASGHQGLLYFFGENTNATRLGKSKKNALWLRTGYGGKVLDALEDKPTICSGSTMGEQVAIETYLRALINEHDEGTTRMTGSDQGFHNYLYYSGKLLNADTISQIIVWEQGRGIINNLGALRTDTLTNWGIRDPVTSKIYQWDGASLSPVVHQWDRDKAMHMKMMERHRQWTKAWAAKTEAQNEAVAAQ